METPRSKSHLDHQRGVRVVGRIRPDGQSSSSSCSLTMSRSEGEMASIAFGELANGRKDSYKLDWCYGQDEGTEEVFDKEVRPILRVTLRGGNGCVIAYGARGSGKTQLIQGSEKGPGLALMTISEILPAVEEMGGSVTISCYQVCQDRIYDLLEPKEQEVLVMEDVNRKIQLKGLSQVPVKSITDFKNSYFHACNELKPSQKVENDVAGRKHRGLNIRESSQKVENDIASKKHRGLNTHEPSQKVEIDVAGRNHKGLIVNASFVDKESNNIRLGKMTFVDLAGYEDSKRESVGKPTLSEIVKVNKSLYALLNVVCALNSSDTYVPYRQTKLTHLLQDFISKTSRAVVFTCLNQTPCQDTIHAVSLASRSCQAINKYRCDSSSKSNKSGPRFVSLFSPNNRDIKALSASVKKPEISQLGSVERKGYGTPSVIRRRRPQPLNNSQKKPGTVVCGKIEKNINEVSCTTKERIIAISTNLIINTEKEITESCNPTGNQSSVVEVASVADEQNILKATEIESSISEMEIIESCNPTGNQSSVVEVNASLADEKNILEATEIESSISKMEITQSCNPKDKLSSMVEVNACGADDQNLLKATEIESCISVMDKFERNEHNDVKDSRDIGLTADLHIFNDPHVVSLDKEEITISKVGGSSPTITQKLREISNSLKLASSRPSPKLTHKLRERSESLKLPTSTPISESTPQCKCPINMDSSDWKTPDCSRTAGYLRFEDMATPQDILKAKSTGLKKSLVQECLAFLNSANKEELRELKGIGEKRSSYILELRETTPEPFKDINDLKDIGLSSKQIRGMMSQILDF